MNLRETVHVAQVGIRWFGLVFTKLVFLVDVRGLPHFGQFGGGVVS